MLSSFLKQKTGFGLDISESSMRLMQLKPLGTGFYPSVFADVDVPKGLIVDDKITSPQKLADLIVQMMRKPTLGVFDSRYVVLSVPEAKSFVRVIAVPKMTETEAAEAVPFEAEQYIPMSSDQVYLDFRIVPQQPSDLADDKMRVVICAAPKSLIDSYVEVTKLARLKPLAVELESEAVARSLIPQSGSSEPTLILDGSAARTNLIIYDQGTLQFTSSLPIGGNSLSAQLAQSLTISFEEAEKFKRQLGLLPGRDALRVSGALAPLLRSLVEAIRNTINFYREHSDGGRQIKKILLSGGACKIKGLADYLSRQVQTDQSNKGGTFSVHVGDPWVNVLEHPIKKIPPIAKLDSISYTTVIGLALRGMDME